MVSQEHRSKGVFFGQGFRLQPVVCCPSRVYQGITDRKSDARWEITILNSFDVSYLPECFNQQTIMILQSWLVSGKTGAIGLTVPALAGKGSE